MTAFHAADRVWPHSTGKGVVVAVIDSGVRSTHEDLLGHVLPGKDFSTGGDGRTDRDPDGHGTAMASLIAGQGHGPNHSEGIEGLAPGAEIMPLAVDSTGTSNLDPRGIPDAVLYATDHGAQVISMSLGSPASDAALAQAIAYAEARNVVVVASSGNEGGDRLDWPAAYPGVVSVGAADRNGALWADSNTGAQLTLTAPGVRVVGAASSSDSAYAIADGTSDATAYVAATVALVRSAFPHLTAGQVINRMIKSAINPDRVTHDIKYGYGIVRPDAALTFNIPPGPASGPLPQETSAPSSESSAPPSNLTPTRSTTQQTSVWLYAGLGAAVVVLGLGGAAIAWRRTRLL
ncbi:type VII secretion-associated serine protease mycosin [Streptacidiphilus fuscans]|uniref:Type VII secretion-associated serine protease mycosin n=1 Tax=Streptacidiphilus fuscans TaxID=2789292 RepID=A0A931B5C1_9ACTN|nr:type VII secretion-associated serine protease mycosin [Streptacidiphilus fuscans]MBF9070481.1 type VII secretion-associated serine protease mycosin [Streptacidiphilus fuscans]